MAKDHFVPQFYLRNFQIPARPKYIYLYRRKQKPRYIAIKSVAQADDYYDLKRNDPTTDRDMVDTLMGLSETKAAPIIQRLLTAPKLTLAGEEKAHLSWFVGLLGSRTPFIRESIASIDLAIRNRDIKKMVRDKNEVQKIIELNPDTSPEEIKKACDAFLEGGIHLDFDRGGETEDFLMGGQLEFAQILVDVLQDKYWNLIETNNSLSFLTSDNPVATMPTPSHPRNSSFGYIDGNMLLPISPKRALLFTNRPLADKVIAMHRGKMPELQFYTITQCHTSVFSHVKAKEFQRILDSTEEGKVFEVHLPSDEDPLQQE